MRRLDDAVQAVLRHRWPEPWCWEVVVKAVCDDMRTTWDAEHAVIQAGPAVSAHADQIAASLKSRLGRFARASDHKVETLALALAGTGDLRALPALQRLAEHGGLPYDRTKSRIMAALPSAELAEVMLTKLRRAADDYHRNTTTLDLLALCGAAAAPAVDEVARRGRNGRPAAFATGRVPRAHPAHPRRAAWAHWRVTGDPSLALDVCGAAVRSGTASHGLPFLADLGPAAARTPCAA